ncbi:hypothetical protein [Clostridium saccharoperbutylacetonicum]
MKEAINNEQFSEVTIILTDEKNGKTFAKRLTYGELALILKDIKLDWKCD